MRQNCSGHAVPEEQDRRQGSLPFLKRENAPAVCQDLSVSSTFGEQVTAGKFRVQEAEHQLSMATLEISKADMAIRMLVLLAAIENLTLPVPRRTACWLVISP